MAVYGERRKAVAFNLNNDLERQMYQYASKINFSQMVKRYLAAELRREQKQQQPVQEDKSTLKIALGGDAQ